MTLVVEEPVGVATMQTDEGKLAQILRNFLSNAAKFTERGEIRLAAQAGPGDTVIFLGQPTPGSGSPRRTSAGSSRNSARSKGRCRDE